MIRDAPANVAETTDYDPRYDSAQTIKGAKARYVDPKADYSLDDLERDIERLLREGEAPDPYRGGHRTPTGISPVAYEKKCPTCGEWGPKAPCESCKAPESLLGNTRVK